MDKNPSTFHDWLRATQPLLTGAILPESFAIMRDGMALAWDAAIASALAYLPADDYPVARRNITALLETPSGVGKP